LAKKKGATEKGNYRNLADCFPDGAKGSVEDKTEEQIQDEITLHTTPISAADHGIATAFKDLGKKLENLLEIGAITREEAIALAEDVRGKTSAYGTAYVAKEKERFAKLEQTVYNIISGQKK
jgi:hypothetical protein